LRQTNVQNDTSVTSTQVTNQHLTASPMAQADPPKKKSKTLQPKLSPNGMKVNPITGQQANDPLTIDGRQLRANPGESAKRVVRNNSPATTTTTTQTTKKKLPQLPIKSKANAIIQRKAKQSN